MMKDGLQIAGTRGGRGRGASSEIGDPIYGIIY